VNMMMKGTAMSVKIGLKSDKIELIDPEIDRELRRLSQELDLDGDNFKAGYLELLVGSLSVHLQLNKKQTKIFAEFLKDRADRQRLSLFG
jgi:hypothetical protein